MPSSTTAEQQTPMYTALRILGIVVLLLMLVSIVYSGWIAIANWDAISV